MIHEMLYELLKKLAPFSNKELNEAERYFEKCILKKNDYFLKAGDGAARIGFVEQGILRTFYNVNNKEVTTDFLLPGSIAAGMLSFLSEEPQEDNIIALENTMLTTISKANLFELYYQNWKWQQAGRRIVEFNYLKIEDRAICLQTMTARKRYHHLLKKMPGLIEKVPLQYIASYLGMSPETLSRIRHKKHN